MSDQRLEEDISLDDSSMSSKNTIQRKNATKDLKESNEQKERQINKSKIQQSEPSEQAVENISPNDENNQSEFSISTFFPIILSGVVFAAVTAFYYYQPQILDYYETYQHPTSKVGTVVFPEFIQDSDPHQWGAFAKNKYLAVQSKDAFPIELSFSWFSSKLNATEHQEAIKIDRQYLFFDELSHFIPSFLRPSMTRAAQRIEILSDKDNMMTESDKQDDETKPRSFSRQIRDIDRNLQLTFNSTFSNTKQTPSDSITEMSATLTVQPLDYQKYIETYTKKAKELDEDDDESDTKINKKDEVITPVSDNYLYCHFSSSLKRDHLYYHFTRHHPIHIMKYSHRDEDYWFVTRFMNVANVDTISNSIPPTFPLNTTVPQVSFSHLGLIDKDIADVKFDNIGPAYQGAHATHRIVTSAAVDAQDSYSSSYRNFITQAFGSKIVKENPGLFVNLNKILTPEIELQYNQSQVYYLIDNREEKVASMIIPLHQPIQLKFDIFLADRENKNIERYIKQIEADEKKHENFVSKVGDSLSMPASIHNTNSTQTDIIISPTASLSEVFHDSFQLAEQEISKSQQYLKKHDFI